MTQLILGMLLLIASALLAWLRYSIHHNANNSVSNTTYSVWGLVGSPLFPICDWFPLAIIVWALTRRLVGSAGKPVGHVGLIVLLSWWP